MKQFFKKRLRTLGLLYILLTGGFFTHAAYDFEKDGIYYKIISDIEKTVEVTSGNSPYSGSANFHIPSLINYNGDNFTVKKIDLFSYKDLTSLQIPESVTEIIEGAFQYMGNEGQSVFTTISVDEANEKFSSFDGALYNKDKSFLIFVPEGKSSITFSDNLKTIETWSFISSQITDLRFPDTLEEIKDNAFNGLSRQFFSSVWIPNSVTKMNMSKNRIGSPNLISLDLPANIIDQEFSKNKVENDGYAFNSCLPIVNNDIYLAQVGHVGINGESQYVDYENEMIYSKDKTTLYYCPPALSTLSFNSSLRNVHSGAFNNFHGIENLKIQEGVVKIGYQEMSKSVSSLTLPSTVKSLNSISGPKTLYSLPLNPPTIEVENGYFFYEESKIYVYPSALESYQNAEGWKNYIEGLTPIDNLTSGGLISAEDCEITKGKDISLNINLKNYNTTPMQYSGFQFDIEMPEGLIITDVKLSDELNVAGFEATNSSIAGNPVRVISYKTNGNGVSLTDCIVKVTIKADANATDGGKIIKFTNAKLSSAGGTSMALDDSSVTVTVKGIPVSAVTIVYSDGKEGDLYVGDSVVYSATVSPADASDKTLTWSIEDPSIASISTEDDNSKVTVKALKIGETNLKATANDGSGVFGTVTIKVVATPISMVIITSQDNKTSIYPDETLTLTVTVNPTTATAPITYKWTSDTPSVATVTDNTASVTVTAVKTGTTNITVIATNQAGSITSEKFTVTVVPRPITSVTLNKDGSIDMYVNDEETLRATVNPSNATDPTITWTSNKPEIATVDNGKITAKSLGTAVITATASNEAGSISASITVNVIATSAQNVTLNKSITNLKVTEKTQLSATVTPAETTYKQVTWTSTDANVAEVDDNGLVTAKKAGTARIIVTVTNTPTVKAECEVTVRELNLGDANDDGEIDVADVVTIVNLNMGFPVDNYCLIAADADQSNISGIYEELPDGESNNGYEYIDLDDVTETLNIIFAQISIGKVNHASPKISNDKLIINEKPGRLAFTKNIELKLANSYGYSAFQAHLILPEGSNIESLKCGGMASNHTLTYNVVNGNILKVMIYSLNNAPFNPNDDLLLTLDLSNVGKDDFIKAINIKAADTSFSKYTLSADTQNSGILDIEADVNGLYRIYNLNGVNIMNTYDPADIDKLEKGLYIINSKKVMIK